MKKSKMILLSGVISILSICGCGVVSEEVDGETPIEGQKGYYLDSNVSGLQYTIDGCTDGDTSCSGYTLSDGSFPIQEDKGVTFHIAGMKIDYVSSKYLVDGAIITAPSNPKLLSFLQSLDSDGDASNGIKIDKKSIDALKTLNIASYSGVDDSSFIVSDIITKVKAKVDTNQTKLTYIDESSAFVHYQDTMSKYQPHTSITVQSALDKLTTLLDNIESYDENSIASEISVIKTMVDGNHTLSGDRGTQDLPVAQALIELAELTNQEYISDIFEFKNSSVPNLSHFVKDMTFTGGASMGENNFHPFESLTTGVIQYKDENSTNLVANADKMSQQTATKLKSISDKLGKALSTMPRNYTFSYNGTTLNIDQFQALRASLLAMASKLSFMSAYAKGDDSYYKTQVYTEGGNSYEYTKMDIYAEDFFNDPKVGLATDQTQLSNAKTYLMESSRLLKDLDAIGLDENHTSAMQTNIDYASSLYKILKSGSGIWELKDVNSSDSISIDVNRLYNTSTAIKVSDFGTTWKEECPVNYTLAPVADRIKIESGISSNLSYCIKTSNSTDDYNYYHDVYSKMKPSTKPTTSTSGLDDIITKIVTGGVTKTGQEILDHYTLDDSSNNDNIVWAKIINRFIYNSFGYINDMTTDSSGNVFVAG
ncbi:MAG: hypothetical protein IE881_00375, partial [Epsilonproteobacteria bacterium]|nr:hypothetical protein [Campylobacterota bacterium]